MKFSPYTAFNFICFSLFVVSNVGIFWIWRNSFVRPQEVSEFLPPQVYFTDTSSFVSTTEVQIHSNANIASSSKESNQLEVVSSTLDEFVVLEKQIPKQINLAVPFTSQAPEKNWDQPWQDACEEAALLMLDAYYKGYTLSPLFSKDEMLKMVKWEEEINAWGRSIEIEKIQKLVQYYSKKSSHIIENPTVDQIKQYVAAGTPVYVVADGKILPNPHFQNGGPTYHALVIRGYTEESFITNDPGTQFGENYLYKYNDLMNAIRDWNSGDVVHGRRVILVVD